MKRSLLLAAPFIGFTVGALLSASEACAETKPHKPTVCADFAEATSGQRKVGVCYDSKRPRIFTSWTYVTVDGKRYAVGS